MPSSSTFLDHYHFPFPFPFLLYLHLPHSFVAHDFIPLPLILPLLSSPILSFSPISNLRFLQFLHFTFSSLFISILLSLNYSYSPLTSLLSSPLCPPFPSLLLLSLFSSLFLFSSLLFSSLLFRFLYALKNLSYFHPYISYYYDCSIDLGDSNKNGLTASCSTHKAGVTAKSQRQPSSVARGNERTPVINIPVKE